jgi:hypothetical protein
MFVFAIDHEEASRIFESKKYWQWETQSVILLGPAIDKNSDGWK